MTLQFIFLYSMTVFIASMIPGPSMLLALTHGMQYGVKKTVASALGNMAVTLVQASVSIAGLGTILIASEPVFHIIKWAGAAYLVYMGLSIFFSPGSLVPPQDSVRSENVNTLRKMFFQAALVTAGNPKAIVFFSAIFPQFIDPDSAYLFQSFVLLGLCASIAFSCFMFYAVSGRKMVSLFSKAGPGKYLKKVIGGSFIGAGVGLAASNS